MTILNKAGDGHFNILVVIYQNLLKKKFIHLKDLINLCAPEPIVIKEFNNTLNTWIDLGLIVDRNGHVPQIKGLKEDVLRNSDIELCLLEEYKIDPKYNDLTDILKKIPKVLINIIFLSQNNKNFWESENNKSSDFTRALAWILAQDIYNITTSYKYIEEMENYQLTNSSYKIIKNDTRWAGFSDWMLALGFCWNASANSIQIDPTDAIKHFLPDIFKNKKELTSDEFMTYLASYLPVLDQGKYRIEVENNLNKEYWLAPKEKEISLSLSLAIRSLEEQRLIDCFSKSDVSISNNSSAYIIKQTSDQNLKSVTHIEYLGDK